MGCDKEISNQIHYPYVHEESDGIDEQINLSTKLQAFDKKEVTGAAHLYNHVRLGPVELTDTGALGVIPVGAVEEVGRAADKVVDVLRA